MRSMAKMTLEDWYRRLYRAFRAAETLYLDWSDAVAASRDDGVRIYDRWAL